MDCNFIELCKRNTILEKLTQLNFSDYTIVLFIEYMFVLFIQVHYSTIQNCFTNITSGNQQLMIDTFVGCLFEVGMWGFT